LVIGYHGTDLTTAKNVINTEKPLFRSENQYDWLGHGIYFWENDKQRASEYIKEKFKREKTRKKPAVIGAVIDLGFCLNLLERIYLEEVKMAYDYLKALHKLLDIDLPINKYNIHKDNIPLKRYLDCAVIQNLHSIRSDSELREYDTVRSAFIEGNELYENAGFREKNHIQICVRNYKNIIGYFWPL
jgi:hypothetical protein